jgi:aminoglycoside 3-N-acetyltransferase
MTRGDDKAVIPPDREVRRATGGVLEVTRTDVASGLRRLGIGPGDTVFFHSSLKSLGHVVGGPDAVIDGFLDATGATGTVVVPVFTLVGRVGPFGSWYDHEASPSTVGRITETLRRRPDAVRSVHPIHSVAALGRLREAVTSPHARANGRVSPWCDAAFAHDSPLDLLVRWNAWYVLLGVGFHVQTLMHYVETILADAVLRRARPDARPRWLAGVRRWGIPGVWASLDRVPLGEALVAGGTYRPGTIGAATVYLARMQPVVQDTLRRVLGDPERWLNAPFREWMGPVLEPDQVFATYTAPGGAPPLDLASAALSCAGHVREELPR